MPRKLENEAPYDPIKAEVSRSAVARKNEVASDDPFEESLPPLKSAATAEAEPSRPAPAREAPRPQPRDPKPKREPREQGKKEQADKTKPPEPNRRTTFKHFKVTTDEDFELGSFLQRIQQKAKSKVTLSVLARSLFHLAMHAEEELVAELQREPAVGPRPANEDDSGMAKYEENWLLKLSAALLKAAPPAQGLPIRNRAESDS